MGMVLRPAYDMLLKLLIIGDSGVGKSSLLLRYCDGTFTENFISTIGVDFKVKTVCIGGKVIKLQIWDTAGQERFRTITNAYYRGAQVVYIVYDTNDRNSFVNVENWWREVIANTTDVVKIALIGNKNDADTDSEVSFLEGKRMAKRIGAVSFTEASALTGANVIKAFETPLTVMVSKHLAIFKDILQNVEKAPWMRSKLMVIGRGRAGKTATVRSLLNEPFQSDLDSTIGASLTQTQITSLGDRFEKIDALVVADYTTQVATKEMAKLFKQRGNDDYEHELEAFKYTNETILSDEMREGTMFKKKQYKSKLKPLMKEEEVAKKFDAELFINEKEAENGLGIAFTIWDYGGQHVFYTLHHLFLTKYGVYLLVFDMRQLVNMSDIDSSNSDIRDLFFWLNSVKLHASNAPIILVGTFMDVVSTKQELVKVNKLISQVVSSYDQIVRNPEGLFFFPINNVNGEGRDLLSKTIDAVARRQDFVNHEISLRWLRCLDLINEEATPWITFERAKTLGEQLDVNSSAEIIDMLSLFNELGVLVYITSTDALRNVITKDPQWLIDCFGKVIRDSALHMFDIAEIEKNGLHDDVNMLFRDARISEDLLEYLWDKEAIEFLLSLMKRTLLLSDWEFGPQDQKFYLIPSLMTSAGYKPRDSRSLKVLDMFNLKFDFSNAFLPTGVFERLVCLAVAHSGNTIPREAPILGELCCIWFGENSFGMRKEVDRIVCFTGMEEFCNALLTILTSMLHKLNQDVMSGGLKFEVCVCPYDCSARAPLYIPLDEAKKQQSKPWFTTKTDIQTLDATSSKDVNLDTFLSNLR